jgi:hypothetical protein
MAGAFHATYEAPPECPDRAAFVRDVEQRLPGWRHSDTSGADRELAVTIEKRESVYAGRVALGEAHGNREVDGPECASVVRALSLVTAVSLDPAAALAVEEPAPVSELPPPPIPDAPEPEPRRVPKPGASFALGAGGALMFGPAPAALWGPEVHAEIGSAERRFSARLSGEWLTTGSVDAGSAPAHFTLAAGELGGCHRPIRGEIGAMGCAVFAAGRIEATGEPSPALVETERSVRLWLAAGARMEVTVRLVGPLELGAGAGLLIPITRQAYVFRNPEESVHESAPVVVDARLGLSVVLF